MSGGTAFTNSFQPPSRDAGRGVSPAARAASASAARRAFTLVELLMALVLAAVASVLQLMRLDPSAPVNESLGRDICRFAGIKALILPRILAAGEAYELHAVIIDPGRERLSPSLQAVMEVLHLARRYESLLPTTAISNIRVDHEMGLTLKQVANRTGLSVSLISQIELGKSAASLLTLYKLSTALGVKMTHFFEEM